MFTLVANTVQQIVQSANNPRKFRISSDSTTMARIASTKEVLEEAGQGGQILTAYESILVYVPPGGELYAISIGTPNISATEIDQGGVSIER